MSRITLGALATLALAVILVLAHGQGAPSIDGAPEPATESAASGINEGYSAHGALAGASLVAAGNASRSSGHPSARLVAELQASIDWRVFALSARTRPEEGGYFYAMFVANLCAMGVASQPGLAQKAIASSVTKTGTVSPNMIELADRLANRCGSFAPNEASELFADAKLASENEQHDPIVVATRELSDALATNDLLKAKSALEQLFAIEDPLAPYANRLLIRVMSRDFVQNRTSDPWFDGAVYSANAAADRSTLELAMSMTACGSRGFCEQYVSMLLSCIGGQFCTDSYEDYFRNQYVVQGGMPVAQFADAAALSKRIAQAIEAGDADAFIH